MLGRSLAGCIYCSGSKLRLFSVIEVFCFFSLSLGPLIEGIGDSGYCFGSFGARVYSDNLDFIVCMTGGREAAGRLNWTGHEGRMAWSFGELVCHAIQLGTVGAWLHRYRRTEISQKSNTGTEGRYVTVSIYVADDDNYVYGIQANWYHHEQPSSYKCIRPLSFRCIQPNHRDAGVPESML